MSEYIKVIIDSEKTSIDADISGVTGCNSVRSTDANTSIENVKNILSGIQGAVDSSTVSIYGGAKKASAILGLGGDTAIGPDEVVTINGVTFTAKDSGASGLYQFNIGITGPNHIDTANNIVSKVNAATNGAVADLVTAASSGVTGLAYVTFTADEAGICGNGYTITTDATGSTGTSASFSGGTNGPTNSQVSK